MTLIVSTELIEIVEKSVPKDGIIDTIRDLAAITLRLNKEHISCGRLTLRLHKVMAWNAINSSKRSHHTAR